MQINHRRQFLTRVGSGMLLGSLGPSLAGDLGISSARAADQDDRLTFGKLEPLVALMQETPLSRLQGVLVDRIRNGTDLPTLVAAGSLANARTFGGNDYVGFHTFMALTPALAMAAELPDERSALPVLKVLYRNTERIQKFGGSSSEVLRRIDADHHDEARSTGAALQAASRKADYNGAEKIMASLAGEPANRIFNRVQYPMQDVTNVHRVVLAWRAWQAIDLVGEQHASTLLRQSVRFCLKSSADRIARGKADPELWTLLPQLLDQYKLLGTPFGDRRGDDQWAEELAWTIFQGNRAQAADATAQAVKAGYAPDQIAEAISIAANLLLLHDPGRKSDGDGDKVKGTVHGASVGVHASDAANAWRNIARVSDHRNAVASLLVGAYHTAGQSAHVRRERWPFQIDAVQAMDQPTALLATAQQAIQTRDQATAAAAAQRYGELGGPPRQLFNLLLKYATSEDGALHAEKYYRTVAEEFANTRKSMRWRQLIALARVSASEFGTRAPGYQEACELLHVDT